MVWVCSECLTRVGCHPGTASPLGTMADEKTRRRRIDAHMAFDALWSRDWRKNGKMSRTAAYRWLASEMDLEEIHIGELGIEDCERVIRASISLERAHGGG